MMSNSLQSESTAEAQVVAPRGSNPRIVPPSPLESGEDRLDRVYADRMRASVAGHELAHQVAAELIESEGWSAEDLELLLASSTTWFPEIAPRLRARWRDRKKSRSTSATALARGLLARWRFKDLDASDLYFNAESLMSRLKIGERDPLAVATTLHVFFVSMRRIRADYDDLPKDLLTKTRRAINFLRLQLAAGDYRKGTAVCPAPELLLCVTSEMWRDTVPFSAEIRPALEQAVRWELQVEAAESPLALAALIIAGENLHLKGIDPREQRIRLLDALGNRGGPKTVFRRLDGTIFPGGPLLERIFVARALVGQPRTGPS